MCWTRGPAVVYSCVQFTVIIRLGNGRKMCLAGHVTGEEKTGLALGGESLEQETTWRLECRWEDNIKMDLN
jgi:hypothetical protein